MLLRIVVAIGLIVPISLLSAAGYIAIHPIPIVLMFHSVVPQPQGVDISPEGLASILGSAQAARDHVIATTDSSDRSVYEVFAPRVLDRQFTAILFLMPPLMDRNGMMTWDEVRELDRAGFIIASHTLTHPWLPDLSDQELWCELCASKQRLEAQVGHPLLAVAYPYGAFNEHVIRVARQCGYAAAYSTAPGRRIRDDDPLAIKRVTVTEATVANPLLRWLALSGYWVTVREVMLGFVPVDIPRKPKDWSYEQWRKTVGTGESCREGDSMSREKR